MTRDTERHIAKLEKTAQALKEASLAGPYANRITLAWDLEAAAKRARENEKLLKRAEKMIEQDREQLQQFTARILPGARVYDTRTRTIIELDSDPA